MTRLRASYTVERYDHGVLVKGEVPVGDLMTLAKAHKEFTLIDAGIASALDATLAFVSAASMVAWRKEIEESLAKEHPEVQWAFGVDTGTSSMNILRELGTNAKALDRVRVKLARAGGGPPSDPDDFGRCFRLLERFPAWRERMGEVAREDPRWTRFVAEWPELEALYREEIQTGSCPRLYERMKALRGRG